MKARINAERARERVVWDKKITALNCPDCFGDNWLINEAGETVGKCDHRRTA
jgi:hypothetical protein